MRLMQLGELTELNPRLPKGSFDADHLVSFVPMAAVSEMSKRIVQTESRPYGEVSKGYTYFDNGDLIVAKITPCYENGKMAIVEDLAHSPAFGSTEFHVIRPGKKLLGRFLFHLLQSPAVKVAGKSRMKGAAGQKRVPTDFFKDLKIPCPPIPEQKRIAAILDAADALRAKRRETLTQLDTLLQSTFLEMFGDPVTNPKGWEVAKLGHVSSFFAGSTLPDGVPFSGQEGGFLCLKVSDLNSPDNSTTVFSSKLWTENRGKGIAAPANSVVIPKRGGAIGTNKKRILSRAAVLDPNLMAIGAAESLEPLYLYHWFFTFDLLDITSGSSVPQLNKRDLTPLPIPVPPADLQARFATIVQSVEQQKSRLRAHLDELDTLFASLQARAFAGEL